MYIHIYVYIYICRIVLFVIGSWVVHLHKWLVFPIRKTCKGTNLMVDLHIDYSHYIMVCIHLPHEITKWWFQTFVIFTKNGEDFHPF